MRFPLFLMSVVMAVSAGCGPDSNERVHRSASKAAAAQPARTQVSDTSPMWAKLASIQAGNPTPSPELMTRFQRAFTRFAARCPDPDERVADFLVKGHRLLSEQGKSTTLLELTEGVATMLDTAASSGGIPTMKSCAEPVALMVTTLQAK